MQNIVISIRIPSLYGSQLSSVVSACKTATLGPELLVSMGPRRHLCFLQSKQRLYHQNCKSLWVLARICGFRRQNTTFASKLQLSMGPSPHLYFCAFTTATLWPESQVFMGPRPHLCFFCIPNSDFSTIIASFNGSKPSCVVLCIHNSDITSRTNSLYGSQTSPVILCMQNSVISTRITSLHGSQTSFVAICMQNKVRITSPYGSQPSSVFFLHAKQRLLDEKYKSLWVPDIACWFVTAKQRE